MRDFDIYVDESGQYRKANLKGADGLSAYQIAVEKGYVGTQSAWLADLRGKDGVSPKITVAETVTGAVGLPAKVENIGTDTDVKLKFTVPQISSGEGNGGGFGFFTMRVDDDGNLYIVTADGETNPFRYDSITGDLYFRL